MRKLNTDYFRNIIFGAEDSLVSTVGVLAGISTATQERAAILLTGVVVIAVEALSMGAGSFLTEISTHERDVMAVHKDRPWIDGLLMFFSYAIAGIIVLAPYLIFNISAGRAVSIGAAVLSLFLLGFAPGRNLRSGLRMSIVAGLAILVGYFIGQLQRGTQF